MNEKPFPDSYWVLPGRFLAGSYPAHRYLESVSRQRLTALLNAGIDTFIDLTCSDDRDPYLPLLRDEAISYPQEVRHRRFSFPDFDVPEPAAMTATLDAIDAALAEGRKVYVHCVGGIGRTGTTVACWLIRHGMQPEAALRRLGELYADAEQSLLARRSPESDSQVAFILNWPPFPSPPAPLPKGEGRNELAPALPPAGLLDA